MNTKANVKENTNNVIQIGEVYSLNPYNWPINSRSMDSAWKIVRYSSMINKIRRAVVKKLTMKGEMISNIEVYVDCKEVRGVGRRYMFAIDIPPYTPDWSLESNDRLGSV